MNSERNVVEAVGELKRGAVALARRVPRAGAHEHLAKPEEMVRAHALRHGVVEQLNRGHRVLPCARHIADEVEEHREQPVAARHEVAVAVLRGPLVDFPDELAARRVLALAAEHVGLDQLCAPQRALITQCTGASLQHRCGRIRSIGVREGHHLEEVKLSSQALLASPDGGRRGCCVKGLRSIGIGRSSDDSQTRCCSAARMWGHGRNDMREPPPALDG